MHVPVAVPPSRPALLTLLRERFRLETFRPGQEAVLDALLAGHDVLAVLPTGAGKSLVFQLASQVLEGVTIVVSPLLALMRDQEESLEERGLPVAAINSELSEAQAAEELARVERGEAQILYVTPERLLNEEFMRVAQRLPLALLAVDEAHCISDWGQSFRPAFLAIGDAARRLGRPIMLALTATATPWVRRDIVDRLGMREPEMVVRGTHRPNLFLEVRQVETEDEEYRALKRLFAPDAADEHVPEDHGHESPGPDLIQPRLDETMSGSGIIYAATTRAARETAEWLTSWGVSADYYHGQRSKRERARVQDAFMRDEIRVIAATNAFGLGVDKPDVRFVVHRDVPGSLEAYYQEAGRAGRDGGFARCLLLYRSADLGRAAFLSSGGRLDQEDLGKVCTVLRERGEVTPTQVRKATGLSQLAALRIMAALEHEGVIGRRRGKLRLLHGETTCEAISLGAEERQRAYERSRLDMMRGYAELRGCRHEYILNYFGEVFDAAVCQMCDNSLERPTASASRSGGPFAIGDAVLHDAWGDGLVERVTPDSVTVLFDSVGFKTLDPELVVERGLLEPASTGDHMHKET